MKCIKTHKGFTLIELLVVIAIIAILAAILFPVFSKAREKSKQSACVSNMKQIGTAIMQYIQDYDDMMPCSNMSVTDPDTGTWYCWITEIYPYIEQKWQGTKGTTSKIFICPASKTQVWSNWTNYMYNRKLGYINSKYGFPAYAKYGPRTIGHCVYTERCAVLADGLCATAEGGTTTFDVGSLSTAQYYFDPRHNDGINVLFADFHVRWDNVLQKPSSAIEQTFSFYYQNWWPYP